MSKRRARRHSPAKHRAASPAQHNGNSAPQNAGLRSEASEDVRPQPQELVQDFEHRPDLFQRFPVECFPAPVQAFVIAQAKDLDCDESAVALPVLSALASSIGSSQRIRLKRSWTEPAILWTALVARDGSRRNAPRDAAVGPLRTREWNESQDQHPKWATFEQQWTQYRLQMRVYDGSGPLPARPERPVSPCYAADDGNVSSLIQRLARQPRGLLVCGAEVDEWLDRALSSRRIRGDQSRWLELYHGRSLIVELRSRSSAPMMIPHASACLTGRIDTDALAQAWSRPVASDGVLDRLLLASPPVRPRQWTDDEVTEEVTGAYADILNRLISGSTRHRPESESSTFVATPNADQSAMVELTSDAKRLFAEFVNESGRSNFGLEHPLKGMAVQLESSAARLALVLHLARWSAGEVVDPALCDETSMSRGITLARWFANEARRIHRLLGQGPGEQDRRALLDWLDRHGGEATARDLCRSHARRYPTMEAAEHALDQLASSGLGTWSSRAAGAQGGRPCRVLSLNTTWESTNVTLQEQVEVVSANLAQRIDNFDALNSRQLPERDDSQDSHPTDGSVGLDQDNDCEETPNDPTQGWKKALDKMFGQFPARENEQNGDLNWD